MANGKLVRKSFPHGEYTRIDIESITQTPMFSFSGRLQSNNCSSCSRLSRLGHVKKLAGQKNAKRMGVSHAKQSTGGFRLIVDDSRIPLVQTATHPLTYSSCSLPGFDTDDVVGILFVSDLSSASS